MYSVPLLEIPPPPAPQPKKQVLGVEALLPLMVLAIMVRVPELNSPPPYRAKPWRMVTFERVTWTLPLGIVTTPLTPPPSIIVVLEPEPITFKLMPMVRFSE